MSTSTAEPRARDVRVSGGSLIVMLVDGREITARVDQFPRLARGTPAQLAHWEFIGGGIGIHWPDLDEDILGGRVVASGTHHQSPIPWLTTALMATEGDRIAEEDRGERGPG